MSLLYSSNTVKDDNTSATWLERQMSLVCGACLKKTDIDNLNVQYFNDDILNILFQMYSVLYNEYFPNVLKSYMVVRLLEPTQFEPIFHVLNKNEDIVHVFNIPHIESYFNFQDSCVVKQVDVCRQYLLEVKSISDYGKISEPMVDCIKLNELQTMNLVKLFIMCDHALEHLYYYMHNGVNDKDFDKTHKHFGTNMRFLSALISDMPKKNVDEIVYDRSMKVIEEMFKVKFEEDGSDDETTETVSDDDCGTSDFNISKYM